MLKIFFITLLFPTITLACPVLVGHYPNCHSEIKQMKGEYVIEQVNENNVEIYSIKYRDEDGNIQEDQFKTDGKVVTRKQTIPSVGVKVRVEGSAICEGDAVVSDGKAYFMGAHVGNYATTIFKESQNSLTMKISADYLGKHVDKLIQCKE
jgi:hypothetical protein